MAWRRSLQLHAVSCASLTPQRSRCTAAAPPARDSGWAVGTSGMSCRLQNRPPDRLRQLSVDEHFGGIKVVFAGFVDDPQLPQLLGLGIGNRDIDLPALQGGFVALVIKADDETCCFGHGSVPTECV